jgi:hypothetical protein
MLILPPNRPTQWTGEVIDETVPRMDVIIGGPDRTQQTPRISGRQYSVFFSMKQEPFDKS